MKTTPLSPAEIELLVESIHQMHIKDLGTRQWIDWHKRAHEIYQEALKEIHLASKGKDGDFEKRHIPLVEAFIKFEKADDILYEAIEIHYWKFIILPMLLFLQPNPKSTIIVYSLLLQELLCISMLNILLQHEKTLETMDNHVVDLLEHLVSTCGHLLCRKYSRQSIESPSVELTRLTNNVCFEIGIKSISCILHFVEHLHDLPRYVLHHIYRDYDIPMIVIKILRESPWKVGDWEYVSDKWKETAFTSVVNPTEIEIWHILMKLLMDDMCPIFYTITELRKDNFVTLLPRITPVLVEQIPRAAEFENWIFKTMSSPAKPNPPKAPRFMLPLVEYKDVINMDINIVKGQWLGIAEIQKPSILVEDDEQLKEIRQILCEAYNIQLIETSETSPCAKCGNLTGKKCSKCEKIWYCSNICQIEHWSLHRDNCCSEIVIETKKKEENSMGDRA